MCSVLGRAYAAHQVEHYMRINAGTGYDIPRWQRWRVACKCKCVALIWPEGHNAWPTLCRQAVPEKQDRILADVLRTVIVVDDSDDTRDMLTLILEQEGYRVLPVEDGATAITMSRHLRPALITLDMRLPGVGGEEVLRRLKGDPETADIPVLVISGLAVTTRSGASDCADAVLRKPFEIEDLRRAVTMLVAGRAPA